MLEQLYFTWSTVGLGGVTGFRVRAASNGVADINGERYNSFKPYLNYTLPQGTDAYAATKERAPFGLIFAHTGKERVIAQQVYIGKDAYNRPGVYFVHLIAGLTENFSARDAIDLWKSRLWDTTDAKVPNSLGLDLIAQESLLQRKGTLNEYAIANVQTYLPLLIQTYLTLGDNQKIYIAASNEQVAALIWGLAHSLPLTLQRDLTFSAYEYDVLKATERIVGTSQAEAEILKGYVKSAQILPAECYTGKGIAIDCYSGKTSDLKYVSQEIVDYSHYATACLVQGRKKELDDLLDTADRLETKDVNEFLAFCKLYSSLAGDKALTQQEVTGLLSNEKLVAAFLHQEKVQRTIINLAVANPGWWSEQAAPALLKLRPPFDAPGDTKGQQAKAALTTFAGQVAQTLYATMVRNQTRSSETLMHVLYAVAPPNKDVSPWLKLLQSFWEYMAQDKQFHPAKAFSWEFRAWLLQQWAYGYQYISDELIIPWLPFNWDDFSKKEEPNNFLALPGIPDTWRQLALMHLLSHSTEPLPKEIVKLFNNPKYQPFCLNALKELMRFASTQPAALRCFQKLVQYGYGNKIFLLMTLLNVRTADKKDILTPERLDEFLHAARMKDKEKIELLEQYGSLLLGAGHQKLASALVDIITVYVGNLSVDNLLDKSAQVTLQTLDLLGQQVDKLPPKVADHIKVWWCLSYGIARDPFVPLPLEKKFLTAMGNYIVHFKLQNDKKYRESLFIILINSIKTNTELRCVYESFVPVLADRKATLLFDLSAFISDRFTSNLSYEFLLPYVYEALTLAASMRSAEDREDFLRKLFKALLKNVSSDIFNKIRYEVSTWSKEYLRDWQAYAVPPEPKSLLQKVGDVGGNVLGGVGGVVGGGAKAIGGMIGGGRGNDDSRPPSPQSRNGQSQGYGQNQPGMNPYQGNQQVSPTSFGDKSTPQVPYNPNDYQQQGGVSYIPPAQNPIPPQQHRQTINEPTPIMPSVQSVDTSSQNQLVSPNAQTYNYVPAQPQTEPVSTVNKQPIYPQWIVTVYKLKGPYIEYRDTELKKEHTEYNKKKLSFEWILDEQDLLRNLVNTTYILKILEMDVIVQSSIAHFQIDTQPLLEKVYKDVQKIYKDKGYTEEEIKNVLLVFVRYRVLSEYFRKQEPPIRLKYWLEKQWLAAEDQGRIVRSSSPLPDVK